MPIWTTAASTRWCGSLKSAASAWESSSTRAPRKTSTPVVLSTDDELKAYLKMLDGKGVYKGLQAEWTDWMTCFSPELLAQLDYVLTDAMTFPGRDGQRVKL